MFCLYFVGAQLCSNCGALLFQLGRLILLVVSKSSPVVLVYAIPIKCFVSHRPVSCDGGRSVGRAKKNKKK